MRHYILKQILTHSFITPKLAPLFMHIITLEEKNDEHLGITVVKQVFQKQKII